MLNDDVFHPNHISKSYLSKSSCLNTSKELLCNYQLKNYCLKGSYGLISTAARNAYNKGLLLLLYSVEYSLKRICKSPCSVIYPLHSICIYICLHHLFSPEYLKVPFVHKLLLHCGFPIYFTTHKRWGVLSAISIIGSLVHRNMMFSFPYTLK